ncbi:MAG: hypothetical protein DHS80DRAFT_33661 [Piptocephalis tieghemiana]|nr:MAG: hypothetical protein DHS80DRAFT_33661 [Piptocephalis tieghemiana]
MSAQKPTHSGLRANLIQLRKNGSKGARHPVKGIQCLLGREGDIRIHTPHVSAHHATIFFTDKEEDGVPLPIKGAEPALAYLPAWLIDTSTNGTLLNHSEIPKEMPVALNAGDVITIDDHDFLFSPLLSKETGSKVSQSVECVSEADEGMDKGRNESAKVVRLKDNQEDQGSNADPAVITEKKDIRVEKSTGLDESSFEDKMLWEFGPNDASISRIGDIRLDEVLLPTEEEGQGIDVLFSLQQEEKAREPTLLDQQADKKPEGLGVEHKEKATEEEMVEEEVIEEQTMQDGMRMQKGEEQDIHEKIELEDEGMIKDDLVEEAMVMEDSAEKGLMEKGMVKENLVKDTVHQQVEAEPCDTMAPGPSSPFSNVLRASTMRKSDSPRRRTRSFNREEMDWKKELSEESKDAPGDSSITPSTPLPQTASQGRSSSPSAEYTGKKDSMVTPIRGRREVPCRSSAKKSVTWGPPLEGEVFNRHLPSSTPVRRGAQPVMCFSCPRSNRGILITRPSLTQDEEGMVLEGGGSGRDLQVLPLRLGDGKHGTPVTSRNDEEDLSLKSLAKSGEENDLGLTLDEGKTGRIEDIPSPEEFASSAPQDDQHNSTPERNLPPYMIEPGGRKSLFSPSPERGNIVEKKEGKMLGQRSREQDEAQEDDREGHSIDTLLPTSLFKTPPEPQARTKEQNRRLFGRGLPDQVPLPPLKNNNHTPCRDDGEEKSMLCLDDDDDDDDDRNDDEKSHGVNVKKNKKEEECVEEDKDKEITEEGKEDTKVISLPEEGLSRNDEKEPKGEGQDEDCGGQGKAKNEEEKKEEEKKEKEKEKKEEKEKERKKEEEEKIIVSKSEEDRGSEETDENMLGRKEPLSGQWACDALETPVEGLRRIGKDMANKAGRIISKSEVPYPEKCATEEGVEGTGTGAESDHSFSMTWLVNKRKKQAESKREEEIKAEIREKEGQDLPRGKKIIPVKKRQAPEGEADKDIPSPDLKNDDNDFDLGDPPTLSMPLKGIDWVTPGPKTLPGMREEATWSQTKMGKAAKEAGRLQVTSFFSRLAEGRLKGNSRSSKQSITTQTSSPKPTKPRPVLSPISRKGRVIVSDSKPEGSKAKQMKNSVLGKHQRDENHEKVQKSSEEKSSGDRIDDRNLVTSDSLAKEEKEEVRSDKRTRISSNKGKSMPFQSTPRASSKEIIDKGGEVKSCPSVSSSSSSSYVSIFRAKHKDRKVSEGGTSVKPVAGIDAKENKSTTTSPAIPSTEGLLKRKRTTTTSTSTYGPGKTATVSRSSFWNNLSRPRDRKLIPARRVPLRDGGVGLVERNVSAVASSQEGSVERPKKKRAIPPSSSSSSTTSPASSTMGDNSLLSRPTRRVTSSSSLYRPTASSAAKARRQPPSS